ncbi:unnamed protein product [Didymodactylos carnosus]|uniref:Uncharacterized protein n=1 Tax=Didymodactylos carnosus TaxID=1234261 RepID=A0A814A2C7_9BILA|nr:unnamed protein product [Didymodactylos carnosus]CAF0906392.1 unnamed protein product [Didymodactylos carnosus]CAF3605292.1 unnamed protein product [Didymodactylos carnosus]CAF3688096.1 unnamed protein product [Didymodactylos carnosus]
MAKNINLYSKAEYSYNSPHQNNYVVTTSNRIKNYPPTNNTAYHHKKQVQTYTVQGHPNYHQNHSSLYRLYGTNSTSIQTTARPQSVLSTHQRHQTYKVNPISTLTLNRICTKCRREPAITTSRIKMKDNYFTNLCENCNEGLNYYRERPVVSDKDNDRVWKP